MTTASCEIQDHLWQLLMQLTGFLADRGILRQNAEMKRLISSLTVRQQQVIREVYLLTREQPDGVPLKKLAERLELSPGTVSEAVETLVRKNALVRETCPSDRRSVQIRVSAPGMEMINVGIDQYRQDALLLLGALTEPERPQLLQMLDRMREKLPEAFQRLHR